MKYALAVTTIAMAVLAACSSSPNSHPTSTVMNAQPQKIVGLLEVKIQGIGDGGTPFSSARFVDPASLKPGLQAKTFDVYPVNGSNAINDVQIVSANTSFFDDDRASPPQRYISSSFDLVNRYANSFGNLTLVAVDVPGVTLGGTAVANMSTAAGTAIMSTSVARSFQPMHAMRATQLGLEVNPNLANVQFFTADETTSDNPNGLGYIAHDASVLPNSGTVLDYGFVASNRLGGRTIMLRNTSSDCTVDACKGTVTLSYKLPRLNPRASNPWAFSLYFVVADDGVNRISQSLEEQTANTVAGGLTWTGWDGVRTLSGSIVPNGPTVERLCRVRTAITPDAFLKLPSGSLDFCFGVGGKVSTSIGANFGGANALEIQADGKIVVAGDDLYVRPGGFGDQDFTLVRYMPNGGLDFGFGVNGKVSTPIGPGNDSAFALGIQSDGKIVVAGNMSNGNNNDFAVVRYNTNGSLDTTFDTDGIVTTGFGVNNDDARALVIQSDGKILVAGSTSNSTSDLMLVRFNTNGSLDTTFDTDGKLSTDFGSSYEVASSVGIQSDGKILVAGTSTSGGISADFALARYNTNGSLDTTFDGDGKVTTAISATDDNATALRIQSDGKIVLAGYSSSNGFDSSIVLARYNTNGSLDTTFDTDGKVITVFGANFDDARALGIQSDGKILIAGRNGSTYGEYDVLLARYNPNGSLDTTLDGDGQTTIDLGSSGDIARALGIQSDGKVVIAGSGGSAIFATARFHP
jgi:uncharacterized delta-60 repeat protein